MTLILVLGVLVLSSSGVRANSPECDENQKQSVDTGVKKPIENNATFYADGQTVIIEDMYARIYYQFEGVMFEVGHDNPSHHNAFFSVHDFCWGERTNIKKVNGGVHLSKTNSQPILQFWLTIDGCTIWITKEANLTELRSFRMSAYKNSYWCTVPNTKKSLGSPPITYPVYYNTPPPPPTTPPSTTSTDPPTEVSPGNRVPFRVTFVVGWITGVVVLVVVIAVLVCCIVNHRRRLKNPGAFRSGMTSNYQGNTMMTANRRMLHTRGDMYDSFDNPSSTSHTQSSSMQAD